MPNSKNDQDQQLTERLAAGLNTLLAEFKATEIDFAVVKNELDNLRENVKSLSRLIRDGNGDVSLLTKIALLEQKLDSINSWIDNHRKGHEKISEELEEVNDELESLTTRIVVLENDSKDSRSKLAKLYSSEENLKIEKRRNKQAKNLEGWKIRWEFIGAVALAIITFALGYWAK